MGKYEGVVQYKMSNEMGVPLLEKTWFALEMLMTKGLHLMNRISYCVVRISYLLL